MDLKEMLGDELYAQVSEKLGDHKLAIVSDGTWIPKEKFDAVNSEKNQLKSQLKERDAQLEDLGSKAKGHEELQAQIAELQAANQQQVEEYQKQLQQQQFDFSLDKALSSAKVRNAKAVRALLDLESVQMDGDSLKGLEDQLAKIKESDGYLFESEESAQKPTFTTGQHNKSTPDADPFVAALFGNKQ